MAYIVEISNIEGNATNVAKKSGRCLKMKPNIDFVPCRRRSNRCSGMLMEQHGVRGTQKRDIRVLGEKTYRTMLNHRFTFLVLLIDKVMQIVTY